MAGIMVSASTGAMNSLLGKLTTLMGKEFAKIKNLRREVKFIADELTDMKDALEELSHLDELDRQTKRWRDIVREISYDIEDIFDDFMQNIGENHETDKFVSNIVQRLNTLRVRHQIASQIDEVKKIVLETSSRRQRYKFDIPPSSNVVTDPRIVTLYKDTTNLVGMEGPTNELVNLLIDEDKKLKVVSIVGFGGLGKTTLANMVYGRLKEEFNGCAFVSVSQKPDIPSLLRRLLSKLGIEPSIHACESHLLDKLREHLQKKRYLIIIDDLWSVSAWAIIKCAFPENDLGSRVIVTTRILEVATACRSNLHDYILEMKPLDEEDSRRLFFYRIFGSEQACPQQLTDVSIEILKKCGGLPLAIISISSMLASEGSNQKERWKDVRDSLGSGTNLTLEGVRQILNHSYKDLPPRLKTCFLYLGMYPEDYKIDRSDLERQWIAEGFIGKENGQDVERTARNYFNVLVNRSLIQPVTFNNRATVTHCRVHDMMLDLILLKCSEENFLTVVDDPQKFPILEYKVRRLSIRLDGASNGQTIEVPKNTSLSQVRSVMFFRGSQNAPPLSEFKFLRVIFIHDFNDTEDVTGLCKLYQLRYISIPINCQLPSEIVHLPHLIHLKGGQWMLSDGIGNMKSLRYLYFTSKRDNIKSLGELTNLRYLYLCCSIGDVNEKQKDDLCSSLGRLCNLEELEINSRSCMDGLTLLSPPSRLERLIVPAKVIPGLSIRRGWFSRVPSWMGHLHNLSELKCYLLELLNDGVGILAELPALTHLCIIIRNATKEMIVISGEGAFPALKCFDLELSSASYLTFQAGVMPKLQRLVLRYNASGSEQNGAGPAGIEHLSVLEEFAASIGCGGATESEKMSAESALRSAINMHPNHPRVVIKLPDDLKFWFARD